MNPMEYSYTHNDQHVVGTLLPLSSQLVSQVALRTLQHEGTLPTNDALSHALEEGLHQIALMHAMQQQSGSHQALMEYLTGHVPLTNEWLNHTN
ncbi:MAG: hypothetical protein QE263_06815 [Vampirovibrionales bacterium]|nr:hypothetical protein [Vampirovibrionales bacterium]